MAPEEIDRFLEDNKKEASKRKARVKQINDNFDNLIDKLIARM